jgi:hypothetical protein
MSEHSGSDTARNDRNGDSVSSDRYVPFYIQISLKTDVPYRTCIFAFSPPSSPLSSFVPCNLPMAMQVLCHGSNRGFTPRSLSQHITRSQDTHCHCMVAISHAQMWTTSGSTAASLAALASIHSSQIMADAAPGDEDHPENSNISNNNSDPGEFTTARVAAVAAKLKFWTCVLTFSYYR